MGNRFAGKECVLCAAPSIGVGEHVWPSWFLREFAAEGPFGLEKNGVPLTRRDGMSPVESTALPSIHVPMCESCNQQLSSTIEVPAKDIVRRLIIENDTDSWPVATVSEVRALARWLLKVGLLGSHPEAEHDNARVQRDASFQRFAHIESEWFDWMRDGRAPPDGFSVYFTRQSVSGGEPDKSRVQIELPDVSVDGKPLRYMARSFGFRGASVTLVWHPRWPILHPLVEDGRAVQLWPEPTETNFSHLPIVDPKLVTFQPGLVPIDVVEDDFAGAVATPISADFNFVQAILGFNPTDAE